MKAAQLLIAVLPVMSAAQTPACLLAVVKYVYHCHAPMELAKYSAAKQMSLEIYPLSAAPILPPKLQMSVVAMQLLQRRVRSLQSAVLW